MKPEAIVLADSISPAGHRLTTLQMTIPRIVLAEFNTHRVFTRNSASSRAIPVARNIQRVKETPFVPTQFGRNQKGMQAEQALEGEQADKAREIWLKARDAAASYADRLAELGVHKQLANRLIEPFNWQTIIVSATEWSNYFNQRRDANAQPEIRIPSELAFEAMDKSKPRPLSCGEWHLPLVRDEELASDEHEKFGYTDRWRFWVRICEARCARVSYLTHDGRRDLEADLDLGLRLWKAGHPSPWEHPARPMTKNELDHYSRWRLELEDGTVTESRHDPRGVGARSKELYWDNEEGRSRRVVRSEQTFFCGNFQGWVQHRKTLPGEGDILGYRKLGLLRGD